MATLSSLILAIQGVIQDESYTDLADRINEAVNNIAAGVRMPNMDISPPLPDLFVTGAVPTVSESPFLNLPSDYQRNLFYVVDSLGNRISPCDGGNYYSFTLFLNHCTKQDLSEPGPVRIVCVKGSRLYYQGIPASPENITVMYYRKPVDMLNGSDKPDGIPEHLQTSLIKHYVCKEIFGEGLEDGAEAKGVGTKYHTAKFFEAMTNLIDYIGITDAEPEFYASPEGDDGYGGCLL